MPEDIASGLIEAVTEEFHLLYGKSTAAQSLLKKVQQGAATYAEAQEYSLEVSRLIGQAYEKHISLAVLPDGKMYYNIASRLIPATLDENYELVSDYAVKVQRALNENAGIRLKALAAEQNQDRVDGLVDLVSSADKYDDVSNRLLSAIENYSQNIVDETIKANADFHASVGLSPKIIRKATRRCCEWCQTLAGEYDYPVEREIYQRHENCRCTVLYDPAAGSKNWQNVHTKQWTSDENNAKIEARKQIGLKDTFISSLSTHPKRLASLTPGSIKAKLEAEGYEIKPLKNGSLKNMPFEEGGGYKVNFGDGGLFQYHPAARSHHGGAYYKISTGKGGTHRYDLEGNEIDG